MARPPVDKRLQKLEQGMSEIKDMLCSLKPYKEDDDVAKEES